MNGFLRALFPAVVLATACAAVAAPAGAQDVPSYARPDVPQETIAGRIISVDGAFRISIRDERGFIDTVQLSQSTIINPTGLSLAPGMDVTIVGTNGGAVFDAIEIDTPYSYDGPPPDPVYYGPGYWYPGFAYGYGPAFSLGWGFGSVVVVQRPFYGRPWHAGYRPAPAPVYGGLRRPLSGGGTAQARRSFGGSIAPTHMDQVYSGGAAPHRAQPEVYTVARPAPAARAAASSSTRH